MSVNESIVADAALKWFLLRQGYGGHVGELGYAVWPGPYLAPGEPAAESACALPAYVSRSGKHADRRNSFGEVVLAGRLREANQRLNPTNPDDAREEALRKVLRVGTPSLTQTNRAFHRMLRHPAGAGLPKLLSGELSAAGTAVKTATVQTEGK